MNRRTVIAAGAVLVAAVAMAASADTLAVLGRAIGWTELMSWALPVSVDVLGVVAAVAWIYTSAVSLGRTLTFASVAVSVALNAIGHLVDTGHLTPGPVLVIGVSAVPPLTAALAVHLAASAAREPVVDTPAVDPAPVAVDIDVDLLSTVPAEAPVTEAPALVGSVDTLAVAAPEAPAAVDGIAVAASEAPAAVDAQQAPRLSPEAARAALEDAWKRGASTREGAELSTRHHSFAARVYRELEAAHGPQPAPGKLSLVH